MDFAAAYNVHFFYRSNFTEITSKNKENISPRSLIKLVELKHSFGTNCATRPIKMFITSNTAWILEPCEFHRIIQWW